MYHSEIQGNLIRLPNDLEWNSHLRAMYLDSDFPPSPFTKLMLDAAVITINRALMRKKVIDVVSELGAKEGSVSIWLSKKVKTVIATEIDKKRLNLITENISKQNINNVDLIPPIKAEWLPKSIIWGNVDLILVNPPSIPRPDSTSKRDPREDLVLYSGEDGRRDIKKIIQEIARCLSNKSEVILVGADYVLEDWIEKYAACYGLYVKEILRRKLTCYSGDIDWEIKDYICDRLGWRKFKINKEKLSFYQLAFSIQKALT